MTAFKGFSVIARSASDEAISILSVGHSLEGGKSIYQKKG
jgi:hypothetical protein